ncbi:MAG: YvcK family protein [Eubacteriales bacterium]|nr:YvcK family protein [Eubacteriales bacterium]
MARPFYRKLYLRTLRVARKAGLRKRQNQQTMQSARSLGPRIAVIGGGTGLSTMLRGLKTYTENITAIVSVSDDGGGSGVLREDLGMLPPGDIRNCITALANTEPTMMELMNYRFPEGINKGQSFGNLFLAALNGVFGSFEEAVMKMNEVLAVTGKVLPVTDADCNLVADFENGASVVGESKIAVKKKQHNCRIQQVRLEPEHPKALPHAIDAILSADMIILGPGSLYTSIIPNLLVDGIVDALKKSKAPKVYVLNIMTQDGETEGYTAFDHLNALLQHSEQGIVDACIYNTAPVPDLIQARYRTEDAEPVEMDMERFRAAGVEMYGFPLIASDSKFARHDPKLLAQAVVNVFGRCCVREGVYGAYDLLARETEPGKI